MRRVSSGEASKWQTALRREAMEREQPGRVNRNETREQTVRAPPAYIVTHRSSHAVNTAPAKISRPV